MWKLHFQHSSLKLQLPVSEGHLLSRWNFVFMLLSVFKEKSYLGYNIQLIELLLSWVLLNFRLFTLDYFVLKFQKIYYILILENVTYFNQYYLDRILPYF